MEGCVSQDSQCFALFGEGSRTSADSAEGCGVIAKFSHQGTVCFPEKGQGQSKFSDNPLDHLKWELSLEWIYIYLQLHSMAI